MKKIYYKFIVALFAVFTFFGTSQAGFDITRMTTIVDDFQGSYTVTNSGRREDMEFTGTELTEFSSFHPMPDNGDVTISGTLSKVIERGEEGLTTSSDGNLVFSNPDNSVNLSFVGLQVIVQEGEEPQISGTVNVNDESFDVAELPEPIRRMLRAVFHLTRR